MKTSTGEAVVTIPNVETMPVAGPIAKRGMIIRNSREQYCRPRDEVEREIRAELVPEEDTMPTMTVHIAALTMRMRMITVHGGQKRVPTMGSAPRLPRSRHAGATPWPAPGAAA